MNLSYSEEQLLLRDSVERYLRDEYDFARRQAIAATDEGYSRETWSRFADMGWLALPLPESCGGLGGGMVETALLMDSFGKALLLEPYLASVVLGAAAVALAGDAGQRAALLPAVAEGRMLLAYAHGEPPGGHPPHGIETLAHRQARGWRIDGRKSCVLGAAAADALIVSARISHGADRPSGLGLFVVPRASAGLAMDSYALVDGTRAAHIEFAGVTVGSEALLGGSEDALAVIDAVYDRAVIALSADALGALSVLLDTTVDYTRTRTQFGQPLAKFQALQHRMADMAVLREEVRAILLLAVLKADAAPAARARAASAAKVKIGRAARSIAQQAVQLHGAMGVTEELNVGAYFKRVLVFEQLFGSADHHLRRYAALARSSGFIGRALTDDQPEEHAHGS